MIGVSGPTLPPIREAIRGELLWFANNPSARNRVDFQRGGDQESRLMPTLVLFLFRFVQLLFSGHAAVAMENAALGLQLAAFQRKRKRPTLTSFGRLFWVGMSLLWTGWRAPLVYV